MKTAGLRLDQAPPLELPLSFFALAPVAVITAGGMLAWQGAALLATPWSPLTLSFTHLGTLGLLTSVMLGALYQMIPVVAGSSVGSVRLGHVVHAGLVASIACLCWGVAQSRPFVVFVAVGLLAPTLLLFVVPVVRALARAPTKNATVLGMLGAVVALGLAAVLGLWIAHGFAGMRFPGPRPLWLRVHLIVALLGWVGGLIVAISWQVLPMFFLAADPAPRLRRTTQWLVLLGVVAPLLVLAAHAIVGEDADWPAAARRVELAALPALLAVWGLHPLLCQWGLWRRRRRRRDPALLFWQVGLAVAPLAGVAAIAASRSPDPRFGMLMGWLAIWGWAGMIIHGMLGRIVPFLVWFHRFAPRIGEIAVPSARGLLPDAWQRTGFALHLASLVLGVLAIGSGSPWIARAAGLALLATGISLAHTLGRVALRRPG